MYTLEAVCALFDIAPMTLRRWCRRADPRIIPHPYEGDHRRRWLDDDQLLRLARDHQRVLIANPLEQLQQQVEQLHLRVSELEKLLLH